MIKAKVGVLSLNLEAVQLYPGTPTLVKPSTENSQTVAFTVFEVSVSLLSSNEDGYFF